MKLKEYKKLHAEWYELVSNGLDQGKEIDFWERWIKEAGEPALELGSGTGRVLVPLLERGYDVTGIDTSGYSGSEQGSTTPQIKRGPGVQLLSQLGNLV